MTSIKTLHKWAAVLVGIQFMIWLGSGLYFNFMDHKKAAGHTYKAHLHSDLQWHQLSLQEPAAVLQQNAGVVSASLIDLAGKPYYLLQHQRGLYAHFANTYSLVDALSAQPVALDDAFAKQLAAASYNGPGQIVSAELLQPPIADLLKERNPVWQVNFADDINTSVYVDAGSGRIAGHSDDHKRLADFFLKLHFMDYANQGSFNNVFMMLFAFVSLWLSGTGLVWTVDLMRRGQYNLKLFARKNTVKLFDRQQKSLGQLTFYSHKNLLDSLVEHNIVLPSTCGGGGTCGRCRIMLNANTKTTAGDQQHFSADELAQGYRLACQHFSDDIEHMTLMDVSDATKLQLKLISSRYLSPFIKELRFKANTKKPVSYKAGAFMRFLIPASTGNTVPHDLPAEYQAQWQDTPAQIYLHESCSRSYSLASVDQANNELVFVIKMQRATQHGVMPGIGSHYLGNLAPGDTIDALGPFEEFYASSRLSRTMVLIGAGSGMAPLKSLIEEQLLSAVAGNREIHFFYGARNERDLIYVDYFYALAKQYTNFHYYPVLSRPDSGWLGATGYAQQVLALNWHNVVAQGEPEFYLCGPKGLMDDTISLLREKGIAEDSIAFDDFS